MPIIYLYISLFRRITEIFRNHTRNLIPESNAQELISFYELIILANFCVSYIEKTYYSVAIFVFGFIIIYFGNYYLFEKLYWKITIPNHKIYQSKALLNTLFILLTIWFGYSFFSIFQKAPKGKDEFKYYRPLPPNHPEADSNGQKFYYD